MREKIKSYVTVTDENGNKIIDNAEVETIFNKEAEIRKFDDGIGLLHVWFEVPYVHFYEKVEVPKPEFNIGDKVKIKSNPKIEWEIYKITYSLRSSKYFYSMNRLSPVTSYNCLTHEYRRAADLRKIKED